MHPDLCLALYRQRERELETAARHRRSAADRAAHLRTSDAKQRPRGLRRSNGR